MSKRIVAVVLSVLLMVPVLPSVSAAQDVNYTVTAFSSNLQPTNATWRTRVMSKGQAYVYAGKEQGGGYYITIPANSQSGYLVVAGIYPIVNDSLTSNAWVSVSASQYAIGKAVYQFTSNPQGGLINGTTQANPGQDTPFTGVVYVPAHNNTLYLWVSSYLVNYSHGCAYLSNAFINFIPETGGADYSSILQQILTQLQNLKSEASNILDQVTSTPAQNQAAQAIVDQIEQTIEEIEELNKQIEDNTNRPDPDDLLPSAPAELLPPSDDAAAAGYEAVSSILASPLMLSLLVMVFTLAFVRYVLFGKHDG